MLFQNASEGNAIVMATVDGQRIDSLTDLPFPRFGMAASWSPDGSRIAIGGAKGQCPHGVLVVDEEMDIWANGTNPPPSMCDPIYAPEEEYLAFSGVDPTRADGSSNIYVGNLNGFGAVNLTGDLRGEVTLLGWVNGSS